MTHTHSSDELIRAGGPWRRPGFAAAALAVPLLALSAASPGSHPSHGTTTPSGVAVHASAAPAAAAAKGPALSIGVSGGRPTVRPGVTLTYTVKIRNIGTVDAPRLHVDQTLPPGLQFISATSHGARGAGEVKWLVSLRPGHAETFRTVARVGKTPPQLLRLATVACASTSSSGRPIVCATDSDQLPAGGVAAARATRVGPGPGSGHGYLLAILILVFAVAVAVAGWRLAVRRRARHAH